MGLMWLAALNFKLKILQSVLLVKHIPPVNLHYGEHPPK